MKRYYIITRKALLAMAAIALTLIFALVVFTCKDLFVTTSAANKLLPIYSVEREDKKIAISFDAAWGADDTQVLIDTLAKYNVKTTFFLVGQWVDEYPQMVKALHDAGHEIQNHSNTHPHLSKLSKDEIISELNACNEKIEAITGVRPTLMRPPYGDYNNNVIEATKSIGMHTVQWSVDSLDWKELTAEEIIKRVTSAIKPGGIVLFHNAAKHTPEALPTLLEKLIHDGYEIVPVSQLIYQENYDIRQDGTQYKQKDG